jgi:predicted transcriptional regulator of viral defense system
VDTDTFLRKNPVFTIEDAAKALAPRGARKRGVDRLRYAISRGKAIILARGLYATVPPGSDPKKFQPDPYLVAASLRPDAVFSHHSALELLGAAHSEWHLCTVLTKRRRTPMKLGRTELRFLAQPIVLTRRKLATLGTRTVHRLDRPLIVTGPERTLLDGFRNADLVGGIEELVESAAGFPVLDLKLLLRLLETYDEKTLWAATGWFLERHRRTFYVDERLLRKLERRLPTVPHYLLPGQRGGSLVRRWKLIVPDNVVRYGEDNESQR